MSIKIKGSTSGFALEANSEIPIVNSSYKGRDFYKTRFSSGNSEEILQESTMFVVPLLFSSLSGCSQVCMEGNPIHFLENEEIDSKHYVADGFRNREKLDESEKVDIMQTID